MLEKILTFLKTCSFLTKRLLAADFLEEGEHVVSVESLACEPVLEKYVDGGSLRQFVFRLSSRGLNHVARPEEMTAFYEKVGQWLEKGERFPDLGEGRTVRSFEVLKTGALADRSYSSNRYGMDCRMIYYEGRGVKDE